MQACINNVYNALVRQAQMKAMMQAVAFRSRSEQAARHRPGAEEAPDRDLAYADGADGCGCDDEDAEAHTEQTVTDSDLTTP